MHKRLFVLSYSEVLHTLTRYLLGLRVRRSDVLSAWSGVRPLVSDPNAGATSAVSRDHTISVDPNSETGIQLHCALYLHCAEK